MTTPPRTWISNTNPKQNELVRVRALIEHKMESGFRLGADGQEIARNIVHFFEAKFNETSLFKWFPETAISQNPYIEFTFVARQSGELHLYWIDDLHHSISTQLSIQVTE